MIRAFAGFLRQPVQAWRKPNLLFLFALALGSIVFGLLSSSIIFSTYEFLEEHGIYTDASEISSFAIRELRKKDPVRFYWTAILFAPVMEELVFRLPLIFTRRNISI